MHHSRFKQVKQQLLLDHQALVNQQLFSLSKGSTIHVVAISILTGKILEILILKLCVKILATFLKSQLWLWEQLETIYFMEIETRLRKNVLKLYKWLMLASWKIKRMEWILLLEQQVLWICREARSKESLSHAHWSKSQRSWFLMKRLQLLTLSQSSKCKVRSKKSLSLVQVSLFWLSLIDWQRSHQPITYYFSNPDLIL